MSFNIITKKVQDVSVCAFVDSCWVLWTSAEDVLQLLRLPSSVLQTIPLRHKKSWLDSRNGGVGGAASSVSSCQPDSCRPERLFIDLYGLGNLCNRVNSNTSDYLCTVFVGECYRDNCGLLPQPLPPLPPPNNDCSRELLERIARQNDLIINSLSQLAITNANQHLELSNTLNAVRLQNVNISSQLAQLIDALETQLTALQNDLKTLLSNLDDRFNNLLQTLTRALTQLQDNVRNELTGLNAILNNLTSTVTNINATLNNVLQAIGNINPDGGLALIQEINTNVDQILSILTPEILQKLKH